MKHPEYHLQVACCDYLNLQYKTVLYMSDTVASCKLTMPQASRNKKIQKDGFKCPDVIIFHPNSEFNGMFIELKVKSPYKKNGELYASEHLEGQQKTIKQLNSLGYYATFATGFTEFKVIVDWYMKIK